DHQPHHAQAPRPVRRRRHTAALSRHEGVLRRPGSQPRAPAPHATPRVARLPRRASRGPTRSRPGGWREPRGPEGLQPARPGWPRPGAWRLSGCVAPPAGPRAYRVRRVFPCRAWQAGRPGPRLARPRYQVIAKAYFMPLAVEARVTSMYQYDHIDRRLVEERVAQFRDQTRRYLAGELSEDDFKALRLRNGLYIQRHAPMLRVSIPYGLLASRQVRMLARIAREFDKGFGHFTTRQNIQFNWPKLEQVPDILALLATVDMHAIQTSGNCIRNVTADHLAGVAPDELEDPRPWCEYIRQWATLHPEFSYLPRKFKIAVTGSPQDRAASKVHDIGLHLVRNEQGEVGFEVLVGGGLGRAPMIGHVIREFLPKQDLLSYLEAIDRKSTRLN